MSKPRLILPLLPLWAACALPPDPEPTPVAPRLAVAVEATAAGRDRVPSQAPLVEGEAEAPPARAQDPRAAELGIWRSREFRRRLAHSYLSDLDVEPVVTEEEREVMVQVLEHIAATDLAAAADLVQQHRGAGASAVFDFTLGNIYYQQEAFERAATAYQLAIDKHPKFRRAWANMGQIHFRLGEFREAVRAFSQQIELGGGNGMAYGLLGVAHSKNGDAVAAESAFRLACMLAPETRDWQLGLAQALFAQGRFADAASLFGSLIQGSPDATRFWLAQGEAFARLGQLDKAAENFEMVDRLGGATPESLANLGDLYAKKELFSLAVDTYLRALVCREGARLPRLLAAAKYLIAKGAGGVVSKLVKGIDAERGETLSKSQRKDLLKIRASLALARGASEEEAAVLKQVVALDPTDGAALILLGQHAARNNEIEQAIFYFERAEGIETSEPDALVRHAEMLVRRGRNHYPSAVRKLRRAQSLKPRAYVQEFLDQLQRALQKR